MNKTQLANALSEKLGVCAYPDCVNFIDAFTTTLFECVNRGEPVKVQGLGTFELKMVRVNPTLKHITTKQPLGPRMVKAMRFVPSEAIREGLNGRLTRRKRDKVRTLRRIMEG